MTNEEINARLAREVMGWILFQEVTPDKWCMSPWLSYAEWRDQYCTDEWCVMCEDDTWRSTGIKRRMWHPTTDPAQMQMVEDTVLAEHKHWFMTIEREHAGTSVTIVAMYESFGCSACIAEEHDEDGGLVARGAAIVAALDAEGKHD